MKLFQLLLSICFTIVFTSGANSQDLSTSASQVKSFYNEFNIAFNKADAKKISNTFLHTPLTMREGGNVALVTTPEDAIELLEQLFKKIKDKGWVRSKSISINLCQISEDIIFLDNEYSRLKADGTAIEPAIRKTLQVWQRINDEWRIVSFYFHDASISIGCEK